MLRLTDIRKTYGRGTPTEVTALAGVNVDVPAGQFVTLIGSNGAGKSTLLKTVLGLVTPDAGRVELGGRDVTREPVHARAREVGRIAQDPHESTCAGMTIEENLAMAARRGQPRGLRRAVTEARRVELRHRLADVGLGLEDRLGVRVGTLSGGQRQALTLLMASWLKPKLLLLDEHTAALDPRSADQVIQLSEEIVVRERLTTLMVTHSMSQATNLGDRLVMMHRGQVIHDFRGAEKQRLRPADLLNRFEDVRRAEQLDESTAEMLQRLYV